MQKKVKVAWFALAVVTMAFLCFACGQKKEASISGTITLSAEMASKIKANDVLFIIGRYAAEKMPPLAVKRIEHPSFPLKYEISAADAMIQGMPFEGQVNMVARVSHAGDAMPMKGDLEVTCPKNPINVGATGADIIINKTL